MFFLTTASLIVPLYCIDFFFFSKEPEEINKSNKFFSKPSSASRKKELKTDMMQISWWFICCSFCKTAPAAATAPEPPSTSSLLQLLPLLGQEERLAKCSSSCGTGWCVCCLLCQAATVPCALLPFLSFSKSLVSPVDGSDQKCHNGNAGTKDAISRYKWSTCSKQFCVPCYHSISFFSSKVFNSKFQI